MDPIEYLFSLERLGMKLGLDQMTRLCAALGDPQHAFQSVIVAGTNGKGSVTAMVERGLRAAGHRTARYTSPHLVRLEERYVIDGREVTTEDLRRVAAVVEDAAARLQDQGVLEAPPTFFECATAIAFVLFREAKVAIAVLEVGLGGRLDATNVVVPLAAAITSIDFDHQAQLGDTLASIASEKAGVIKPGIPVVCGPLPHEAHEVVRQVCQAVGATLVMTDPGALPDDLRPALPGAHQRVNASVAVGLLQTIDSLGLSVDAAAIRTGITKVEWPGRLEEFRAGETRILVDAAHNPAGAQALRAFLEETGWTDCALVFGAVRDKDAARMIAVLGPACGVLICTTAPTPRASPAEELAALARHSFPGLIVESVPGPSEALARARAWRPRIVVAGSIFLIGPLRDILRQS